MILEISKFINSIFYEPPQTIDRYKKCWNCSHGRKITINDCSSYMGQGDYTNHIKCDIFPCDYSEGTPNEK
jgi:hypothetical protein